MLEKKQAVKKESGQLSLPRNLTCFINLAASFDVKRHVRYPVRFFAEIVSMRAQISCLHRYFAQQH